jgi:hypothetical protein
MKHASKRASEVLEEVREQEWKNTHVVYHNAHSVLLLFVASIVLICLLYKLYPYAWRWNILHFCKKQVSIPSAEASGVVEQGEWGSTTDVNVRSSNDSLNVQDATPQSPKRTSRPMVTKSRF